MSSPYLGIVGRNVFLFITLILICIIVASTCFTCIFFRLMTIRMQIANEIIEFVDMRISVSFKEIFLTFIDVVFILGRNVIVQNFLSELFFTWLKTYTKYFLCNDVTHKVSFLIYFLKKTFKSYVYRFFEQSNCLLSVIKYNKPRYTLQIEPLL